MAPNLLLARTLTLHRTTAPCADDRLVVRRYTESVPTMMFNLTIFAALLGSALGGPEPTTPPTVDSTALLATAAHASTVTMVSFVDVAVLSCCAFFGNMGVAVTGFGMAIIYLLLFQLAAVIQAADAADGQGFKYAVFIQALS